MLKFTSINKENPSKTESKVRSKNFDEIYANFAKQKAEEQASRCSQCGVPFCQVHCPLHNNIPDWLKLTAENRLEEAYQLSSSTNNMPEICGRICPQDRLCEGNCVIEQSGHGTVTIGSIEKYITDTAWDNGWVKTVKPSIQRKESVGIIGAGPAGLAAAEELIASGISAEVIDLRCLRPLDTTTMLASVAKTHRAIIIDEGWYTGSLAGEVSAIIMEQGFWHLDAPVKRICTAEVPIPYPAHLEQAALPQTEQIVSAAKALIQNK